MKFLQPLQKTQTGEYTSCHWNRKRPVGSKLYNNLYWNHIRHFSHVVLKILSISTARTLLHFSMHFGVSITSPYKAWINIFNTRFIQTFPHKCITNNKILFYSQTQSSLITFDSSQYPFIQKEKKKRHWGILLWIHYMEVSMWTNKLSQGNSATGHPISNTYNPFSSAYINIIM